MIHYVTAPTLNSSVRKQCNNMIFTTINLDYIRKSKMHMITLIVIVETPTPNSAIRNQCNRMVMNCVYIFVLHLFCICFFICFMYNAFYTSYYHNKQLQEGIITSVKVRCTGSHCFHVLSPQHRMVPLVSKTIECE